MRYYIIAGEASGDLHGSNLMKGIYAEDPQADIRFWGGDCMKSVWESHQECLGVDCGGGFQNRATPLAAGVGSDYANSPVDFCSEQPAAAGVVGARSEGVGGVVLKNTPHRIHAVAAPKADIRMRIFGVYAFHQIGTVKVTGSFSGYDVVSHQKSVSMSSDFNLSVSS